MCPWPSQKAAFGDRFCVANMVDSTTIKIPYRWRFNHEELAFDQKLNINKKKSSSNLVDPQHG